MKSNLVFLLWHVHELDGGEEEILIGVYSTRQEAEAAIARARVQPGIRNFPNGFEISEYEINRDHWTEGFVTA